uniref:acylphosphatase n=1 Tax=Moschus moschiferus TaxID=68415 RepID=A0A8C6FY62_MOSMO
IPTAEPARALGQDSETLGKAQGVFFCKYAQAEGKKLGLRGQVQNTDQGTGQGRLQGPVPKVRHLQEWLETRGNPKTNTVISKLDYSDSQLVK